MSSLGMFSAAEVYDMAVTTEQNGRMFYEAAAAAATSEGVARLMRDLAVAEANHEETFRRMRQASAGHAPRETYEGENAEYVTALLFSRVLPDAQTGVEAVAAMAKDVEAVDFALAFEKDTILFLYEMRDVVSSDEAARVDALIVQEKNHVRALSKIRQQMAQE